MRKHSRLTWAALAALLAVLALPAGAQVTASLAAVTAAGSAVALEKTPAGCWGCQETSFLPICEGGHVPGYWNCTVTYGNTCQLSSPGCGAGAALPLDPDGASLYVSRGAALGLAAELTITDPEYRNCEGAIVARVQTAAQIGQVRQRTASLTL